MNQSALEKFMKYIWVRDVSKRLFDADLDPEVSDSEVAQRFNKLNMYHQNFSYQEVTRLVSVKLSKAV